MGLQISNVNVKTEDGDTLTSFWTLVSAKLEEKASPRIIVELNAFRSEADLDGGYKRLRFEDTGAGLATDVPIYLHSITDNLTVGKYANVDMLQVHNQVRDLLIEGDTHARWNELIGIDNVWAGFGTGNVVTQMPA